MADTTVVAPSGSAVATTDRRTRPRSRWVVARLVGGRAARQGALWGIVFGIVVVTSVTGFTTAYPTAADRATIRATLSSNAGAQALLGPTRQIDTVGGFTAWRAGGVVILIGAVWALLVSTKLLRGEEDAGRWEILLSGRTTRRRAALQALFGLGAGLVAMFATTAAVVVLEGESSDAHFGVRASLFLAVALVASAAVFLAVGALTSQLAATRRRAAVLASSVLGVAFVLRMVAATSSGLHWLRWASPLGWIDELHPLTGSQPLALAPIAALTLACAWGAVELAGVRDLGGSVLPDRDTARARTRLLNGPGQLAVRLTRGVALGWIAAIGALSLVLGLVAHAAAQSLAGSASARQILERLGGGRSGAAAYLGFSFVIVATLVALAGASQVGATRDEEADGRVEHLLVRPVARGRWLGGRVAVAVLLCLACGVGAGVLAWLGAVTQPGSVGFVRMLAAGVNVVPAAVLVVGAGMLALGVRPRFAAFVAYGIVAWSFLVELVGALVKANHWLLDTSVLQHIRPAPAATVDWTSAVVLGAIGLAAAAVGVVAFDRRDLAGA
jgi:ABC-2 type transport system permease protein